MAWRKVGEDYVVRRSIYARFSNKGDAISFDSGMAASEAELKANPRAKKCCTIRGQMDNFLRACVNGTNRQPCSEQTAAIHRRRLERFDRAFHSKPLNRITKKEIEDWRDRRLETMFRGRAVQRDTVNVEIGTLKSFARWAQEQGLATPGLPLEKVKRFWEPGKLPGRNQKSPMVLELDEVMEIIDAIGEVRPDVKLVLDGMMIFCLRPVAVVGLKRGDVYLPTGGRRGRLQVRGIKGGIDRSLPIEPGSAAYGWVQACRDMAVEMGLKGKDAPLVPCQRGRSVKNPGGWTTATLDGAVQRSLEKAGIERRFTPYTVRHATISFLQDQEGIAPANVQAAAAHLRVTTQENYSHRKARDAEPAFGILDAYLRGWRGKSQAI